MSLVHDWPNSSRLSVPSRPLPPIDPLPTNIFFSLVSKSIEKSREENSLREAARCTRRLFQMFRVCVIVRGKQKECRIVRCRDELKIKLIDASTHFHRISPPAAAKRFSCNSPGGAEGTKTIKTSDNQIKTRTK